MKIAILAESETDAIVVRILLEALLQKPIEHDSKWLRHRGWNAVFDVLPAAIRAAYYRQEADAVVAVLDADNSSPHEKVHSESPTRPEKCRTCRLLDTIEATFSQLKPVEGRAPPLTAIAVAPPSIEAWLLCGRESDCTEAGWNEKKKRPGLNVRGEIRRLKRILYGDADAPRAKREQISRESCERLIADLSLLEKSFPNSFGFFAEQVRAWPGGVS